MAKTKYTKEKLQSSPELRLKLYESTLLDYNKGELFKDVTYSDGSIENRNILQNGFCFYFDLSSNIKLDIYIKSRFKTALPELYNNRLYPTSLYYFLNNEERITALIKSIEDVKLLIKQQNELKR